MIQLSHLTKQYGHRTVVDDVTLDFPKGKMTALIGPNGAGKSTIFNMASRLQERSSGQIRIAGRALEDWNAQALSRELAVLTQSNSIQMKITVRELVGFGRFPHSGSRLNAHDEAVVSRVLAYMELTDFEQRLLMNCPGDSVSAPLLPWCWRRMPRQYFSMSRPTVSIFTMPRR